MFVGVQVWIEGYVMVSWGGREMRGREYAISKSPVWGSLETLANEANKAWMRLAYQSPP